jgi:DNA primase
MLILVEGNLDVITLHQAGFDCSVASLGTALTAEQTRLMSRYTDNIVLAYDSDEAGRRAALRALSLIEKTGMRVKVVDMGASKDPDEYLRTHKPDAFRLLIERSENNIEYQLMTIKNRLDMTSDEGRLAYLSEATDLLAGLDSQPEREIYGAKVAREAGISAESVKNEISKKFRNIRACRKKEYEKRAARPRTAMQPDDRSLRYKHEGSAAAEEGIIRCLIRDPSLVGTVAETGFSRDEFTSPFLAKVYDALIRRVSEGQEIKELLIMAELLPNEASLLTMILQKPEAYPNSARNVCDCIEKIRSEKYKTSAPDESLLLEIKNYKQGMM